MNTMKMLVVDDDELSRELLREIFHDEYDIIFAEDGQQAIEAIRENLDDIAAILLDLVMPVLNGYQVLQVLNREKITDRVPVVLVSSQIDTQVELTAYALGAASVIAKPFVSEVVKRSVQNIISLRKSAAGMEEIIKEQEVQLHMKQQQLDDFSDKLLEIISNIVEFRDLESGTHIKRVRGLTKIIANAYMQLYPESGLTEQKIDLIARASVTHDIGKIAIPDNILLKQGRLTDEERKIMMTHTTKGCEILDLLAEMEKSEQLSLSYDICHYHHERADGMGYPEGLTEEGIPLAAQLVSIADVYDALVSERCYKKPYSKDVAYRMILEGECGVFSQKLLKCLRYARGTIELFTETPEN